MMKQDLALIKYAKKIGVEVSQVSRMQSMKNFEADFCAYCLDYGVDNKCKSCFVVTY